MSHSGILKKRPPEASFHKVIPAEVLNKMKDAIDDKYWRNV